MEPTRWAGMTTIECLGAWFIAWKSSTDLNIHFSENGSQMIRQVNVPIHRIPDIRNGRTSMDRVPSMEHRWLSKV